MAIERERKYLVIHMPEDLVLGDGVELRQGYLATGDKAVVRVRTKGSQGFLTIKSSLEFTMDRLEFEYEIPLKDAREMLALCPREVTKRRYQMPDGLEIDVFEGDLAGLILAELESEDGRQATPPPGVLWREVTEDDRYSNYSLSKSGKPKE